MKQFMMFATLAPQRWLSSLSLDVAANTPPVTTWDYLLWKPRPTI